MAPMGVFSVFSAQILAHQGGWDEALLVLAPLILIGLLLLLANRRANAIRQQNEALAPNEPTDGDDH